MRTMTTAWKRIPAAALMLCCLTLCLVFASCGKEKNRQDSILKSAVFAETEVTVPDGWRVKDEIPPTWNGSEYRVTMVGLSDDGEDRLVEQIFAVSPDGTVAKAGSAVSEGVMGVIPFDDGGSVLTRLESQEDGRYTVLAEVQSRTGKTQFTADLCWMFERMLTEADVAAGSVFSCIGAVRWENSVLLLTERGLCALDEAGQLLWKATDKAKPSALFTVENGGEETVFLLHQDRAGEAVLSVVDPATGEGIETVEMPPELSSDGAMPLTGSGYDFVCRRAGGLTGVTVESDENGAWICRTDNAADWVESGIDPAEIGGMAFQDAEHLLLYRVDRRERALDVTVSLLTRIPPEEVPEKQILNVALLTNDSTVETAAARFNRESKTHKVVFTDYAAMETEPDQRYLFFEEDLAAGKIPDAVILRNTSNMDYKVDTYISRELFCDLLPLMKADDTFDDEGLLAVATKPYLFHGGQPVFPLNYSISSLIATDRYLTPDENGNVILTPDEALEFLNNLPDGVSLGRIGAKAFLGTTIVDDYTDTETASCTYDDGRLAARLAAIDALPEEERVNASIMEERNAIAYGSWVLYSEPNLASLDWYVEMENVIGATPVPVSWPNENGKMYGGSDVWVHSYFAIPKEAAQKEAAVDFLETCLSCTGCVHFASDVERRFEKLSEQTLVIQNGFAMWFNEEDLQYHPNGVRFKVTREQADRYLRFLNSVDSIVHECTKVREIYYEEKSRPIPMEQFLETAASRTRIYLSELYG